MIITVSKFEDKTKGDKVWYTVTDENNKEHHLFSSRIPDLATKKDLLQVGKIVQLTKVKNPENPKWWDTTEVKPATAQQAVSEDKSGEFATFHLRQKSIERQNALTNAVTFWTSSKGEISIQQILYTAEDFFNWTSRGLIPSNPPNATPSPPQSVTEASIKTPEDYKKSVNDLCKKLKWKTPNFEAFLEANKNKLGGVDFETFDDKQKADLIILLNKEVK